MNKKEFNYTYSSLSQAEKKQVENIRREYERQESPDGLSALLELDKKVRYRPKAIAVIIGVAGTLVFGTGMSLALVWREIIIGSIVGALGAIICFLTPLIHRAIYVAMKNKYGERIVKLSERLLGEKEQTETQE